MAASICTVIFSRDIEFVEAVAVHKGLQLVMDIGLAPAIIESDSFNVVNLINNKIHSRCEVGWLISDVQEVLSSSESSFQVKFAPRSCNEVAHHLSKLALCNSIEKVWLEEIPTEIAAYVCKDK